jgi:hypothetical protein
MGVPQANIIIRKAEFNDGYYHIIGSKATIG